MKLCNDCDLNYRQSKNKRLLVELTLIQVAQLTAEPEDAGSGHGPKKQLSPVFHTAQASQPVDNRRDDDVCHDDKPPAGEETGQTIECYRSSENDDGERGKAIFYDSLHNTD